MLANRVWTFAGTLSLLLALIWTWVWFELFIPLGLSPALRSLALLFFLLSFALQLGQLFLLRKHRLRKRTAFVSFFFMGLFTQLFFASLLKDLIVLIPGMMQHEKNIAVFIFITTLFLNLWGTRTALKGPLVKNVSVPTHKKHAHLSKFRIVQISDLHAGPLVGKAYIEDVVKRVNRLNADLVVLTGDIGDSHADEFAFLLEPLRNLAPQHGVFYITGNHEYYWNAIAWIDAIRLLGIKPLLNEGLAIAEGKIWLGGVTDPDGRHFIASHAPNHERAFSGASADMYKILLAHQPKNCFAAEKAGFDLMLSGHTHGGQFFPFNLIVGLFNPYSRALNQHGQMKVYVNTGTGFWGPVQRLGVPAEITLLELGT